MGRNPLHETRPGTRFVEPPWNEQSAPWRQIDAQLQPDHLAREIRQAMSRLDVTALYDSYAGRGKTPHRPDEGSRQPRVKMHAKTESMLFQEDTENFPRFSTPSSSVVSPPAALASCSVV